jgi:hypothetical protein
MGCSQPNYYYAYLLATRAFCCQPARVDIRLHGLALSVRPSAAYTTIRHQLPYHTRSPALFSVYLLLPASTRRLTPTWSSIYCQPARGNFHQYCCRGHTSGIAANRARFMLQRHTERKCLSPALQLRLFNALVKPFLSYGSQVWGVDYLQLPKPVHAASSFRRNVYVPTNDLEAVQLRFVRFVLGQSKYSSAWCALHDASMPPLHIHRLRGILRM